MKETGARNLQDKKELVKGCKHVRSICVRGITSICASVCDTGALHIRHIGREGTQQAARYMIE